MAYLSPISDKEEEDTVPCREKMSRVTRITKIGQKRTTLSASLSFIFGPKGLLLAKNPTFWHKLGI